MATKLTRPPIQCRRLACALSAPTLQELLSTSRPVRPPSVWRRGLAPGLQQCLEPPGPFATKVLAACLHLIHLAIGIIGRLRVTLQLRICILLFSSLWPLWGNQGLADSRDANSKASVSTIQRRFEERYRSATRLEVTFLERYSEGGRLVRTE